jgi:hypothetical protein
MSLLRPNLFPVFDSISKVIYIREDLTMLRRSLFVSALLLAGTLGFASSTMAAETDTQDLTFTATVNSSCNLNAPTTGLTVGELAFPDATTKNKLVTTTPAYVGVDCSGGEIKVSKPDLTSYPASYTTPPTLTNTATITLGGSSAKDTDATGITAGTTPSDAMVEMESTNTAAFAAGDYIYTVTVTATGV